MKAAAPNAATTRSSGLAPTLAAPLARNVGRGSGDRRVAAPGSAAARLLKADAMQVEVLRRLKHGTGQYVRVEHVHIHEGGQAVIGNVMARAGDREGSSPK
jgi:hypothetical protein